MSPIQYRPYRASDLHQAAHIWFESWRSSGVSAPDPVTELGLLERFEREAESGWSVVVAERGDLLVGFMALKASEGILDQLFVLSTAQRQGVGAHLLSLAAHTMPRGFHLRTAADNTGARRFYELQGLTLDRLEPHPTNSHVTAIYRWG